MSANNELLTIDMITFKGLSMLTNSLVMGGLVNREYDNYYAKSGAKIGDTVSVRKPPRYIGREGAALSPEPTVETKVPVKLDYLFGVDLAFSSVERTLSLDDYANRILKPAVATIANRIDSRIFKVAYPQFYNQVGTPGTVPTAIDTYLSAGVKLDNEAAPTDEDRYVVTNSQMQATLLPATAVYFNPSGQIAEQYRKGRFGKGVLGFDWYMDQNVPTHTVGTYSGSPAIDGAGQTGSSILTKAWGSNVSNLNYGDVFTIAGVYAVNPQNRESNGQLRQFTVMNQPLIADTSGAMTIQISPPITPSGQFQTVDSAPADSALITVSGTTGKVTPQGLAFHKNAIVLATADLELPKGVHEAARAVDEESGIGIRIVTAYDIRDNNMYTRMEVLAGIAVVRPELGVRIAS
jgi:hypothetical protein